MGVGSSIIVCGQRIDVEHPVVTFENSGGYSAYVRHRTDDPSQIWPTNPARGLEGRDMRYRERRVLGRDRGVDTLKRAVRQVVVHHDGCRDARMCFDVLHNQHGLSVHFMVDNDGTIYQTLDLVDCAFHAAGVNETSVGIEIQNRADAARFPNYYREGRPTVTCRVHDQEFLAYDFTAAQYEAMIRLCRGLARVFEVPLVVPRAANQEPIWTTIPEPRQFSGFLAHYHINREKWDPGPWDFQRMFRNIGSKVTFPLTPLAGEGPDKIKETAEEYYEATEQDGGGYFPVGPLGESRLWHGGVHLPGREDGAVYAPLAGRIVAAKLSAPCPAGSCNFVLIKHRFEAGARSFPFFSLSYHLRLEAPGGKDAPGWLARSPRAAPVLAEGRTALLDVQVEAGELIGHVGEAGPREVRRPQVHFAIFSAEDLSVIEPGYWEMVIGTETNRFCRNKEIIDRIDRPEGGQPRDGLLSRRELMSFFRSNPDREGFRRMVVRHLSEWTPGDWQAVLETAPDFAALPSETRRRLVAEQIEPTLWWTRAVGAHAGLPEDGVVYSYHPIGFLEWYASQARRNATLRGAGIAAARAGMVVTGTERFQLDAESTVAMTDSEDLLAGESGQKLTLEELIDGYPD